jgi:hypothetical protein
MSDMIPTPPTTRANEGHRPETGDHEAEGPGGFQLGREQETRVVEQEVVGPM